MNFRILIMAMALLLFAPPLKAKRSEVSEELANKIGKAIDTGTEAILKTQNADGSFPGRHKGGADTSLCVYTILSANLAPKNKRLQKLVRDAADKAFVYLRANYYIPGNTYANGVLLMALEKHLQLMVGDPENPYKLTKEQKEQRKKDLKWMEDVTKDLISKRVLKPFTSIPRFTKIKHGDTVKAKVEERKEGRNGKTSYRQKVQKVKIDFTGSSWGYPGSHSMQTADHQDMSNTQYAILGIAAAYRSGVKIEKDVFWKILHFGLATQEQGGPSVYRYEAPKKKKKKTTKSKKAEDPKRSYGDTVGIVDVPKYKKALKKARKPDQARGWDYVKNSQPTEMYKAYGSMTTAGVACILVGQMGLNEDDLYEKYYKEQVHQAVFDGIGWLTNYFTVEHNPRTHIDSNGQFKIAKYPRWHYYYLYGMERVGMMAEVENFGQHLWYREGATQIVADQKADGTWKENAYQTCFAILFLSRSTKPTYFGSPKPKYKTQTVD